MADNTHTALVVLKVNNDEAKLCINNLYNIEHFATIINLLLKTRKVTKMFQTCQ